MEILDVDSPALGHYWYKSILSHRLLPESCMKFNEMIGFYLKAIDYEILISKSKYLKSRCYFEAILEPGQAGIGIIQLIWISENITIRF